MIIEYMKRLYFRKDQESNEEMREEVLLKYESRQALECYRIANESLGLAKTADEDWLIRHHCVTGTIFIAFAFEGMINHYGRIYEKSWNSLKEPRKDLHKKVFAWVKLRGDYCGTTAYQKINECMDIRDAIAHGKTKDEKRTIEIDKSNKSEMIKQVVSTPPAVHDQISIEKLEEYIDATDKIQKDIEESGHYPYRENAATGEDRPLSEWPLSNSGVYEF